jgi:hypothetical protein
VLHRPKLELSDARAPAGPSWTRRRWLPSWRAPWAELARRTMDAHSQFRRPSERRRAAIRAAVLKGAALPELGAATLAPDCI